MPWNFQYSVDEALNWHRFTNQLLRLKFDNSPRIRQPTGMRGEMVPLTSFRKLLNIAGLPARRKLYNYGKPALQG
jgi:hypothetical protein